MAAADNILKQDIIAGHFKVLYKEIRLLKRRLAEGDRENELGAGEEPQDGNYLMDQRFTFDAVSVTSLIDDFTFQALRTIPTSLDSPGWAEDPEFSDKFLTVTKPPNVSLPVVGDIVAAFFTGTYGTSPAIPTARFGIFGDSSRPVRAIITSERADGNLLDVVTINASGSAVESLVAARPHELRRQYYDGKTFDGVAYTFVDKNTRTGVGSVTETQRVIPSYVDSFSIIYIERPSMGTGLTDGSSPVLWQDSGVGRAWATNPASIT